MEDTFEWQVSQILPKDVLLALYYRKSTLHLASSREDTGQSSTEVKQDLETALDNIPSFIKSCLIITRVQFRLKLLFLGIVRNEFLMLLLNYINLRGTTACQKLFVMLPENCTEVRVLQNNQFMCHYGRQFISALIH